MFTWKEDRRFSAYFPDAYKISDLAEDAPTVLGVQDDYKIHSVIAEKFTFLIYPICGGLIYAVLRKERLVPIVFESVANLIAFPSPDTLDVVEAGAEYGNVQGRPFD